MNFCSFLLERARSHWHALTPVEIGTDVEGALVRLNDVYKTHEQTSPSKGYRVLFQDKPILEGRLIPMGGLRKTAQLSGISEDTDAYQKLCPFCTSTDLKIIKVFEDHTRAILSHSGQVLLIPDKHYSHWFEMPLEVQKNLMKHVLEMRSLEGSQGPLELHCGSAAAQTVFHTHLRTGIFK